MGERDGWMERGREGHREKISSLQIEKQSQISEEASHLSIVCCLSAQGQSGKKLHFNLRLSVSCARYLRQTDQHLSAWPQVRLWAYRGCHRQLP